MTTPIRNNPNEPIHSRETSDYFVLLYWNPHNKDQEFRLEMVHKSDDTENFTILPDDGKDAVFSFHHPFVALENAVKHGKVISAGIAV